MIPLNLTKYDHHWMLGVMWVAVGLMIYNLWIHNYWQFTWSAVSWVWAAVGEARYAPTNL